MSQNVSAEAVEAAARTIYEYMVGEIGWDRESGAVRIAYRDQARAALTAALPYLAAHQPARVVPSAEEALDEQTINERDAAEEMADRLAAALAPADVLGEHSSANDPWQNALDYATSQPTVAEVREQVAREVRRYADTSDPDFGTLREGERAAVLAVAALIARTETKGGE